jgi:sugar lactone lactonase YvrE
MRVTIFSVALLMSAAIPAHARPTKVAPVVVPDTGNNRVLIYNAPSVNGQAANVVLGQSGFESNAPGTSATLMSAPTAFALDAAGQLYVADTDNCRVLAFKPPFTTGKAASLVIGKPDFGSSCANPRPPFPGPFAEPNIDDSTPSQTNLGKTGGVAIDKRGGLWVSDSSNNRVLHFKAPLKSGQPADMVIGQSDFNSSSCQELSPLSLCSPVGVAVDGYGMLWVADRGNNRVVAYIAPKSFAPVDFAINSLKVTVTTASPAVASRQLSLPSGVAAGPNDAIWVADTANNRVLMYTLGLATVITSKFGLGDLFDVTPQLVLGQGDFFSADSNQDSSPAANTMASPQGVVVAKDGSLWVGDTFNNRTLQFRPPFTNGMDASLVLGQQGFSQAAPNQEGGPGAATQFQPFDSIIALEAGPSTLAVAMLLVLSGAWFMARRLRRKTA